MSDKEDANSRRAARPSTPPFRGPANPAGRSPLTPAAGGSKAVPGQPFAPPAGGRPATPAAGSRKRATPAAGAAQPPAAAPSPTPAYGSPPPASVIATLQSIAEFTIVNETAPGTDVADEPGSRSEPRAAYEAPRATEASFDQTVADGAHTVDFAAHAPVSSEQSDREPEVVAMETGTAAFDEHQTTLDRPEPAHADMPVAGSADPMVDDHAASDSDAASHWMAAARLEALAGRLRAGELELLPVHSDMGTPAVLAAVLAALLRNEG